MLELLTCSSSPLVHICLSPHVSFLLFYPLDALFSKVKQIVSQGWFVGRFLHHHPENALSTHENTTWHHSLIAGRHSISQTLLSGLLGKQWKKVPELLERLFLHTRHVSPGILIVTRLYLSSRENLRTHLHLLLCDYIYSSTLCFISIYGMIQAPVPVKHEIFNTLSIVLSVVRCTPDVTSQKCAFLRTYTQKAYYCNHATFQGS